MFKRHRNFIALIVLCAGAFAPLSGHAAKSAAKQQVIMGWIEYVDVPELTGKLKAKLDTGATTSSIRAEVLKVIEPDPEQKKDSKKNGKKDRGSVVFKLNDNDGKVTTMQRKLVRWVRIKDKYGEYQRRPVVEMSLCVAGHFVQSEVNLSPRADFIYPILIGRNMLQEARIIVDPNRTFTAQARCIDPDEIKALQEEE